MGDADVDAIMSARRVAMYRPTPFAGEGKTPVPSKAVRSGAMKRLPKSMRLMKSAQRSPRSTVPRVADSLAAMHSLRSHLANLDAKVRLESDDELLRIAIRRALDGDPAGALGSIPRHARAESKLVRKVLRRIEDLVAPRQAPSTAQAAPRRRPPQPLPIPAADLPEALPAIPITEPVWAALGRLYAKSSLSDSAVLAWARWLHFANRGERPAAMLWLEQAKEGSGAEFEVLNEWATATFAARLP